MSGNLHYFIILVSSGMFNSSLHGWPGLLQTVPTPTATKDGHLQQPRCCHSQKQEALSHLPNRRPKG